MATIITPSAVAATSQPLKKKEKTVTIVMTVLLYMTLHDCSACPLVGVCVFVGGSVDISFCVITNYSNQSLFFTHTVLFFLLFVNTFCSNIFSLHHMHNYITCRLWSDFSTSLSLYGDNCNVNLWCLFGQLIVSPWPLFMYNLNFYYICNSCTLLLAR